MARRLLLVSNSTAFGEGYLDHCFAEMEDFLGPVRRLVFVPFALFDRSGYGAKAAERFAAGGLDIEVLTPDDAGRELLDRAEAVFVGGGNTFRLLKTVQDAGMLAPLRERVLGGMPYMGASAGSNLAGPTVRTTNDMPIVEPDSLTALDLVPFQINPHYQDPDPDSRHMGETREQRLTEFLEENDRVVVGLREGTWARIEGDEARLGGVTGARIFRRGAPPEERPPGASIDDLLSG